MSLQTGQMVRSLRLPFSFSTIIIEGYDEWLDAALVLELPADSVTVFNSYVFRSQSLTGNAGDLNRIVFPGEVNDTKLIGNQPKRLLVDFRRIQVRNLVESGAALNLNAQLFRVTFEMQIVISVRRRNGSRS